MTNSPTTRQVAVVTGGSRGIGRAFVIEAAHRGYDVVFSHRGRGNDADETIDLASSSGRVITAVKAEMTNPADLNKLASVALALGPVHLLINNAGMMAHGTLDETTESGWNTSFAVHVTAPMLLIREFAHSLTAEQGAVLNVSSTGGVVGSLHGSSYGASKSAVIGLTKALARELAPSVRVNALAPGPVETELYMQLPESERIAVESEMLLARVSTPEEIAKVGMDLCHWTFATGVTVIADGGRVLN